MGDVKLGKTLKEAREKLGLTQKQVAEKTDLSTNWYARFERGEETPFLKTIRDIFKIFKLPSQRIFHL
ncbi:helix-turn-helix transcriptional regulator [Candidatus Nomurabacteria bacterium]|nr:helix-turn-helix transcriptional regulator [Candidatus Nomurabacteria bacterium]